MDAADPEQPDASGADEVLEEVGVPHLSLDEATRVSARVRRLATALRDAITSTALTTEEFAARTGLAVADVAERLRTRTIWSWADDGRTLIPDWALHDAAPLQGLDVVAPLIPEGMALLSVHGLITTPNPDLQLALCPSGRYPSPLGSRRRRRSIQAGSF
ncbi:MAG: hypothetical protein ACKO5A_07740 [Actinomycetota bacterium]